MALGGGRMTGETRQPSYQHLPDEQKGGAEQHGDHNRPGARRDTARRHLGDDHLNKAPSREPDEPTSDPVEHRETGAHGMPPSMRVVSRCAKPTRPTSTAAQTAATIRADQI